MTFPDRIFIGKDHSIVNADHVSDEDASEYELSYYVSGKIENELKKRRIRLFVSGHCIADFSLEDLLSLMQLNNTIEWHFEFSLDTMGFLQKIPFIRTDQRRVTE